MHKRKTKIVCTIGPASKNVRTLTRMIAAGMDVARLNFSHGTHASHAELIRNIRQAEAGAGSPVAIIADLCGPKMRIGRIANDRAVVKKGARVVVVGKDVLGDAQVFSTTYPGFIRDVQVGERVFIDDGNIEMRIVARSRDRVELKVAQGGVLKSSKGFNLPDTRVSAPAVTARDLADLDFAVREGVDYVALSFVRSAREVQAVRKRLAAAKSDVSIIAKIEKPEAVRDIEAIARASDALMVARGDLGVEMDLEAVSVTQKRIIETANRFDRPVITATQMLETMTVNHRPTRAEVSDVSNAIFDRTDAVMLSGETAGGAFPVETVAMMGRIARQAEEYMYEKNPRFIPGLPSQTDRVAEAITNGLCMIQEHLGADALAVITASGRTARYLSKNRPQAPAFGVALCERTARRMCLYYGITPLRVAPKKMNDDVVIAELIRALRKKRLLPAGGALLVSLGHPVSFDGRTNAIRFVRA